MLLEECKSSVPGSISIDRDASAETFYLSQASNISL